MDTDGALLVELPDRSPERRASPGQVARAVLLDVATTARLLGRDQSYAGSLVLLGARDEPLVVLRLQDWLPPADRDLDLLLETSGVRALCAALGVPLEPAEAGTAWDPRSLARAQVRPLPRPVPPGAWTRVLAPLALVLAFLGGPLAGSAAGAACVALALLAVMPVVVGLVRGRAQARAAGRAGQDLPAGTTVVPVRPRGPVPGRVAASRLGLGPDELLLQRSGQSVWLAGPASGGVVQALLEPEHVRLTDAEGRDHATLETALWCGDDAGRDALARQLRAAGLAVSEAPVDTVLAHDTGDLSTAALPLSLLAPSEERGDPTTLAPLLSGAAVAVALVAALLALTWSVPAGAVLVAVALVLALALAREAWRRRSAERRHLRPAPAPGLPTGSP